MDIKKEMREKAKILDQASKAYYGEGREIISNFEYDQIYDELEKLEKESGIILSGSPTQKVGYEIQTELPKYDHPSKMLSLSKTKDREALATWIGNRKGMLSWKLDGLTIVLTYSGGKLTRAVTRGNGVTGEVVTANAKVFDNIPVSIGYQGNLVLRGEAVIAYEDFERINRLIPEVEARYKNPRNLCSGSVRQLDSSVTAKRHVRFYAFSLVSLSGYQEPDFENSRINQIKWLASQGFDTVEYREVTGENIVEAVGFFEEAIRENPVPSDGLVLSFDDLAYSETLGTTAKAPRDAIAFKWADETAETVLLKIEWSPSRTGLINPVAVFEPVELEGTTVTRASLHNVSIAEGLKLGEGDRITVYKANMIIPQIGENLTKSGTMKVPEVCPVCGSKTQINDENGVRTLICPNGTCPAKLIKSFTLFVSREGMNIEGLSEATLEKFIDTGIIKDYLDIMTLGEHGDVITKMEGFGEKSFENLVKSIEKSKDTKPERIIYSLGIPGIGAANAKLIAEYATSNSKQLEELTEDDLLSIDGVGEIMAKAVISYFEEPVNLERYKKLLDMVHVDMTAEEKGDQLSGITFVITGSLEHFENRGELKKEIQAAGGKVSGSVSSKTGYLINNDRESTSGKNKKAKELGIPIISEEEIMKMLGKEI